MDTLFSLFKKTFESREKLLASTNVVALILVVAFSYWNYRSEGLLYVVMQADAIALSDYVAEFGVGMRVILTLGLVLLEVVVGVLPAAGIYPIIGLMMGPVWGMLLISVGNLVGNAINYWQGNLIAGAFVKSDRYRELIDRLEGGGFRELVILRLNPITSFDSISYFAGALGMDFKKFLMATFIGVTPLIVVGTFFGSDILRKYESAFAWLLLFVGISALLVIAKKLWIYRKDKKSIAN